MRAKEIPSPVLLVADADYASGKVIRPLLAQGHHLVTRVRHNAVAFEVPFSAPAIASAKGPRLRNLEPLDGMISVR